MIYHILSRFSNGKQLPEWFSMVMIHNLACVLPILNYMAGSYSQTADTNLIMRKWSKLMKQILKTAAGLILL